MRKLPLVVAGLVCAGAIALAQTTPLRDFTGNELMKLTLGSGSLVDVSLSQVRNTRGISPIGAATTVNSSPSGIVGYLVPIGAITTLHVSLPNPADKGQVFFLANGHTSALATVNVTVATAAQAGSGGQTQTLNATYAGQGLATASAVGWIYNWSDSKWYRIQ